MTNKLHPASDLYFDIKTMQEIESISNGENHN